jgi:3-hydroxy-9,10-secoandrosta-1,3,5(10)-triene-9,17-dione monooxygenase reductase component
MPGPDPATFRRAMALVPTAVTVITATSPEGPLGATANAVVSLSLDPPIMLVALERRSRTLDALRAAGTFGVNVLASDQAELALRFATKEPHHVKWDSVDWGDLDGIPALDGASLAIACELRDELDGGDHAIVTGAVTAVDERKDAPLVFHRGDYRGL